MKLSYNSPAILTVVLGAIIVTAISAFGNSSFSRDFFTLPPRLSFSDPLDYFRMFSHVIGHGDWNHLWGNTLFLLLLGPTQEEKYGTANMWKMILITAAVTALINHFFFDTGLMGASGLVFLLILLGSLSGLREGTIPITFLLIAGIYLTREISAALENDNISQTGHLIGGLCGTWFGFRGAGSKSSKASTE